MSHIFFLSLQVQKILVKWKGVYNSLTNTHTHTHLGVPGLVHLCMTSLQTEAMWRESNWERVAVKP